MDGEMEMQSCEVNPMMSGGELQPPTAPTGENVIERDNHDESSDGKGGSSVKLISEMIALSTGNADDLDGFANLEVLEDVVDPVELTPSFSSSVVNSEEGQERTNSFSPKVTDESNQPLPSEVCGAPNITLAHGKNELSVDSGEPPVTASISPNLHSAESENVFCNLDESSSTSNKTDSSFKMTDKCFQGTSVISFNNLNVSVNCKEGFSQEQPSSSQRETEILHFEDTVEACSEIGSLSEGVITIENDEINNNQEVKDAKVSQSQEDVSIESNKLETAISKDLSEDVTINMDIMDCDEKSCERNDNESCVSDPCNSKELKNVDVCELFEGPIGYGTDLDLDDSPSIKSMAYGCGICYSIVGYTRESFTRHQKNFHWVSLQCKVCKKLFATTKAYENHMSNHIRYPCLHCPKEFKHPLEVEDHQGQHFPNKLIRCERCGEEFYLLATLKQHHSFMGTKCIEIQKHVRRIEQQLESPLTKRQPKCSQGSSKAPKSEVAEGTKNVSSRKGTSNPSVETRRSKRLKHEVKYEF